MRRESGMTLVEVMVSAVVLSMVMLALSASLRTFATTYTAVEQSANRTARLREVTYFLRHVLREAYSPHQGAFDAGGGQISWLAPIDRVGAAGGVTWLRLRREGDALMLDFAIPDLELAEQADSDPEWGAVIPSETLLRNLRSFRVSKLKEPDGGRGFADSESNGGNQGLSADLPPGVQLEWEIEGMAWPPLVVAFDGYRAST
jgi:prepilin-type N-terminal cleavage/methylation domain-containing protein